MNSKTAIFKAMAERVERAFGWDCGIKAAWSPGGN